MTGKVLIDTNILVYAYDYSDREKQNKSTNLLNKLVNQNVGAISTQILSEFFNIITREIVDPLSPVEAETRVVSFCRIWPVLAVNEMIILEAIRGVREHSFSFWDSQVWATARLNQIKLIYSEDFSHDSFIDGVQFINPLL